MGYIKLFVGLLSGIGIFLWGMNAMSGAIKTLMGDKVKSALTRFSNPLYSVGIGAGTTALLHSSSAVTLMTIGFVNAGALSLKSAAYIIMGANVGTTLTGLLVALEAFDLSFYLSLLSIVGLIMYSVGNPRIRTVGCFLAGLGLIFSGLEIMGVASKQIVELPFFLRFFTHENSPFLLLLIGALTAAILQSSTAVNGVIIMLAGANGIGILDSAYIILGTNIGTCLTSLIASAGLSSTARQVADIHLIFNVAGSLIFFVFFILMPNGALEAMFNHLGTTIQFKIANFNLVQNIVSALILLPFTDSIIKICQHNQKPCQQAINK